MDKTTKIRQYFRLRQSDIDDLRKMAKHVGDPGNLTAGLQALIAEWRRLKAERDARTDRAMAALGYDDQIAHIARQENQRDAVAERLAQHEEYCDALDRRAEAERR